VDWSKAKNIIITIFIILNVFLLIYTGIYKSQNNISKETVTSILNILENKGVKMEIGYKLPTYNKKTPMLVMENFNLNKNNVSSFLFNNDFNISDKLNKSYEADENEYKKSYVEGNKTLTFTGSGSFIYNDLDSSIKIKSFGFDKNNITKDMIKSSDVLIHFLKDSKQYKQILKSFCELFSHMNIEVSSFILDKIVVNDDDSYTAIFIETYNKYLVFDNRIRVTIFNDGLKSIDFSISKINGFAKSSSSIMPAHQVLLKNYYSVINDNNIITSVNIGFKGFNDKDEDGDDTKGIVQSPSWRVNMYDGSETYFKAYDGEEIK